MKKVIRITESDLARIVKRVLNENASEIIRIKTWNNKESRDNGNPIDNNFDTTNHELDRKYVYFDAVQPFENDLAAIKKTSKRFYINCGDLSGKINEVTWNNENGITHYATTTAAQLLTKKCNSYVSNDTKVNGDYV